MKIKGLTIALGFLVICGCHFSSKRIYLNRLEDRFDAEIITNLFYYDIKSNNFKSAIKLFTSDFLKEKGEDNLINYFIDKKRQLGAFKKITLEKCETNIAKGKNSYSKYELIYQNQYENFIATETFQLAGLSFGQIKITYYNLEII